MAATAPQALLTGAQCFICYGASTVQAMKLTVLSNYLVSLSPSADVNPQSLIEYGKCYICYGASLVQSMWLALLDQVNAALSSECTETLNPIAVDVSYLGDSGSFSVFTQTGCEWTALSNSDWLTTSSTGTGDGTVNYTVAANTGDARVGIITVEGETFTVNQAKLAPPDFVGDWAWWKADAITASDGDALAQWDDSSGNNHHLTQAVIGSRPVYKTGYIGSLPAINFGTLVSSSFFDCPGFFALFTEGELIMVVKSDEDPNQTPSHIGWMDLGGDLANDYLADFAGTFTSFGTDTRRNTGNHGGILTSWHILGISSKTNEFKFYIDGVEVYSDLVNTVGWKTAANHHIGYSSSLFSEFLYGNIAETALFDTVLSAQDRAEWVAYLQTKYGL